ncbi:Cna B-type domain-containing protein [Peptoniphilus lacydonensis]|uniref:Cna B-type domain-containing protein n=4 Tax=Peptoniphilus lacydonensis TaxID=1673725 RepID=UPI0029078423|nr:Cna B-type domain-containing protein [Peptoniphilus lacydonensis]MDU5378172.1 Cna B-type domain-containing protein [Peptoniphilus lacydonensis]
MLKCKKIIAFFLACLMLLGTIVPTGEAFAQGANHLSKTRVSRMEVKDRKGNTIDLNEKIEEDKDCRLEIDWDASEYKAEINEGDYFNIILPKNFEAAESNFAIRTPDGVQVANAHVNRLNSEERDTLNVVFTRLVEDKTDVEGSIVIEGTILHKGKATEEKENSKVLSEGIKDNKKTRSMGAINEKVEETVSSNEQTTTQTAKLTINWKGDGAGTDVEVKNRPETLAIKLYSSSDEGKTWQEYEDGRATLETGKDVTTVYEWKNLPSKNEDGKTLIYKAELVTKSNYHNSMALEPKYTKDENGNVTHSEFVVNNVYKDNWNYKINLEWNTSDPLEKYDISKVTTSKDFITQQYVLTISNQKVYKAGELEVRIPRELFDYRNRTYSGAVPKRFSIGDEKNPTSGVSYTYRIDTKGTEDTKDDEIVFYNYKDLDGSQNVAITVEYSINVEKVIDCSKGVLQAKGKAKHDGITEELESNEISYRLDTGIKLENAYKSTNARGNDGRIYEWPLPNKPKDFDIDKYNYCQYVVAIENTSNQPYITKIIEKPQDGGELVGVYSNEYPHNEVKFTEENDGSYSWESGKTRSLFKTELTAFLVVVRYPRPADKSSDGIKYKNEVFFEQRATDVHEGDKSENDKNDIITTSATHELTWEDYHHELKYHNFNKGISSNGDFKPGDLDLLLNGEDIKSSFYISETREGYSPDTFGYDIVDEELELKIDDNESIKLGKDDYRLLPNKISFDQIEIDQRTGERKNNRTNEEFVLYGKTATDDDWKELGRKNFSEDKSDLSAIWDVSSLIPKDGLVAFRVVSPKNLEGLTYLDIDSSLIIKGNSPTVVSLREKLEKANKIKIYNIATESFEDINKKASVAFNLESYKYEAELDKWEVHSENDVSNQTITKKFQIREYEKIFGNEIPKNIYEPVTQEGGIFYDLLPLGYKYDEGSAIAYANKDLYTEIYQKATVKAEVVSNNYKDSGRQLVKFKLRSTAGKNNNWLKRYEYATTGFQVAYSATAKYADANKVDNNYNIVAFQRSDKKAIVGGEGFSEEATFEVGNAYDESGKSYLYDPDGDGKVDPELKNTLYGAVKVEEDILLPVETGFNKYVRGEGKDYSTEDKTKEGEDYSYKLRLVTNADSETSNVVLYDILENATDKNGEHGWHGAFKGINTTELQYLGVKPVVYYSTAENLSYNNEDNLSIDKNPGIWSNEAPDDLSKVTAVAFDLRKTPDGSDYVFKGQKIAEIQIKMEAPKEKGKEDYAYNRPAYLTTIKSEGIDNPTTSFNISNPVKIKLEKQTRPTPLEPPKEDIKVEKVWQNKDGKEISAPVDKIEVELYRDGEKTDKKLELNKSNNWSGEFKDLDVQASLNAKEAYKYTIKEVGEKDNKLTIDDSKYQVTYGGTEEKGFKITNKLEETSSPWTPITPPKEDIKVEKIWQGKDGKEISAPVDKIEVELYRDGKSTGKKLELNKANKWSGEFEDLDLVEKLDSEKAYEYTVKEVGEKEGNIKLSDSKYKVSYDGSMEKGFKITNKLEETSSPWTPITPSKEDIKVEKIWQDKDGKEITAPVDKIEVELYRDGKSTGKKLELNKANKWSGEFKDLDVVEKLDSKEGFKYSVKEVGEETGSIKLNGNWYKVNYSGSMKDGFTITNKEEPKTPPTPPTPSEPDIITIKVKKDWTLYGNKPVDKIMVELYRDGKATGKILELNRDNNWSGEFKNLDVKKGANSTHDYHYTVKEVGETGNTIKLDGRWFDVNYLGNMKDGFTIVNKEEKPTEPGKPEEPNTPNKPNDPQEPNKPETPKDPEKPNNPGTPVKPNTPKTPLPGKQLPKTGNGLNPSTYAWILLGLGNLSTFAGIRRKKRIRSRRKKNVK